jgi:hypothetical protein
MIWKKQGLICNHKTLNLSWYKKNILVPLPYLKEKTRLRIFAGFCDNKNISRIGYIDVDPKNPKRILNYSKKPIVDIGKSGKFDDSGVVPGSIFKWGKKLYLFYSGYQRCTSVPYMIFSGCAESKDNGDTFKKISFDVPLLDRVSGEVNFRCAPSVFKHKKIFRMLYTADNSKTWKKFNKKKIPNYSLRIIESRSLTKWPQRKGDVAINHFRKDEHGLARASIWNDKGIYKIIYSIRTFSKKYRLGYAESINGKYFFRKDNKIGISVSKKGWDREMIAFADQIKIKDTTTLFYCGNNYGQGGMGYAVLEKSELP